MFARDVVRYVGEPVAAVAAIHPETCRRALAAIVVEYEVLDPLVDPERAIDGSARADPPGRQRHPPPADRARRPDAASARSSSRATYEIGMQDQAFLGLEAALAVPDPGGAGVELYVATQWLHEDRHQIAACLGLPEDAGAARRSAASAARSARARTSACRCTRACSRCAPAGRCGSRTAAARASSATSTATRRRSGCATTPTRDGRDPADRGALRARRRRLRVHVVGGADQRDHAHAGPVPVRERHRRRLGGAHQQPAVRRDARVRRGAGVLRPRGPDGQARCGVRPRPGRDPAAQRDGDRRPADHRAGDRERRAGRALHPRDRCAAAARRAGRRARRRPDAPARRRRADRRPRPHPPRHRLGCGDQEPDVLGGLRRLLDGSLPPRRRRRPR